MLTDVDMYVLELWWTSAVPLVKTLMGIAMMSIVQAKGIRKYQGGEDPLHLPLIMTLDSHLCHLSGMKAMGMDMDPVTAEGEVVTQDQGDLDQGIDTETEGQGHTMTGMEETVETAV